MERIVLPLLFVLIFFSFGTFVNAAETEKTSACFISDASEFSSLTWISEAPADSPGSGLILGAKALMKGIYTYSPDSPDYLPMSYSNQNSRVTNYTVHANDESSVYWAPDKEDQIQWVSEPGGTPKGWSGTIKVAGPVATTDNSSSLHCYTDCSGFVTSLFTYANTVTPTKFTSWKEGSSIPEAGCNDPQGRCIQPNPLNYYSFFTSGKDGWFKQVSLAEVQPGDIISYANTKNKSDTGHIMLIIAVTSCLNDPQSKIVVIADETGDEHSFDTRPVKIISPKEKTGAGLGMGLAKLSISSNNTLEFYWSLTSPKPEIGSVALGRAL